MELHNKCCNLVDLCSLFVCHCFTVRVCSETRESLVVVVATAQVVVEVADVNDNPPRLTQPSYTVSVPEMMSVGSAVVTVEATDEDVDDVARLTFSISGTDAAYFYPDSIAGAGAGIIRVQQVRQLIAVRRYAQFFFQLGEISSSGTSNSTCSYTLLCSVVCLSAVCRLSHSCPCLNRSTDLDAIWQLHLWGPVT